MQRFVYAHRGGAALAPENTLAAFERGLAAGADGLELDIHLSRDGVPVVHHDMTLERTTDGHGRVDDLTADDLARLDAGYRFEANGTFPFRGQGIGVPRLEEVLRRFPDVPLIIELKQPTVALAERATALLRRTGSLERATLASFYRKPVLAARRLDSAVRTGATGLEVRRALLGSWLGLSPFRPAYYGFQIPERSGRLRVVSRRFVRAVRRAGLDVAVWTVDTKADMIRLLDWGVTGLITDRPDVAATVVRAVNAGARPASSLHA